MSFCQHNFDSSINYSLRNDSRQLSLSSTKDQISQLEEKLSNYEMQYTKQNAALNEQIKQLLKNDSNMKRELENKAKALYQAEHHLKESSTELYNLKAYIHQTENKYKELNQRYTELTLKNKNDSLCLQSLEEENNELKSTIHQLDLELNIKAEEQSDTEIKYHNIEKILHETKANTEIMSKESNTIREMVNECQKENQKMTQEMDKLRQEVKEKDKEIVAAKKEIEQLDYNNNQFKKNNESLLKEQEEFGKKIEQLEAELLKTKEINLKVNDTTKRKDDEITNKTKTVEEMESHIMKTQIDLSNIIAITNENIESTCRWIENYFDGNYNYNDILPELQLISYTNKNNNSNYNKAEPINFILLKEILKTAKINYDKLISDEVKRINELQKNYYEMEKENADKQKALQNILNMLQNELGEYAEYSINTSSNNNRGQMNEQNKESLRSKIESLLKVVLQMPKQKNNNNNDEELTGYIEQLKQDNEHLCYEISQLHSEINYLKTQINASSDMVYQVNKLNEEKMSIEKKNKYLLNEIELKKAQIKSQDQMLSRRMNDENILKQIELDKDNLIKDNLMLISQNTQLKEQIRHYQTQSIALGFK